MKYFFTILVMLFSIQASACEESIESKENHFNKLDINKDGFITKDEWKAEYLPFEEYQIRFDKDENNKLSKEEFFKISFTKGC